MTPPSAEPTPPLLRVVSGSATDEEIAALLAVLSAVEAPPAPRPRQRPEWQAHHRRLRAPLLPGPGGWTASARPR